MNIDCIFRVCIIGDAGSGKTSIINKYVYDTYNDNYISTIGVNFESKNIIIDNKDIKLYMYDVSGDERFKFIIKSFCIGASVVLIVFDLNNTFSFENIEYWLKLIKKYNENSFIIIIGNKKDIFKDNDIIKDIISNLLTKYYNCFYIETSSKTGENINNLFDILIKYVINTNITPLLNELNTIENHNEITKKINDFNITANGVKINAKKKMRSCTY